MMSSSVPDGAGDLDVSRTDIAEAFHRLEVQALYEVKSNRRTFGANLEHATQLWRRVSLDQSDDKTTAMEFLSTLSVDLLVRARGAYRQANFHQEAQDAVDVSGCWLRFLYKSGSAIRLALLVHIEALELLYSADSNRRSAYKSYRDSLLALGKVDADLETLCRMWASLSIITLTSGDTLRYEVEEKTLVGEELLRVAATDVYPQPELTVSLALSYQQLFLHTSQERHHNKAIELVRRVIESSSPPQTRIAAMGVLGTALADFGFSCRKKELLREAYDLHQQVLLDTQKPHTGSDGSDIDPVYEEVIRPRAITRSIALEQSAWTMQRMWDLGCLDETKIDEIILLYEEAIRLSKSELGHGPAARLRSASSVYHLTVAVHRRYRVQDDILSLDDAIRLSNITTEGTSLDFDHAMQTAVSYLDYTACFNRISGANVASQAAEVGLRSFATTNPLFRRWEEVMALCEYVKFIGSRDVQSLHKACTRYLHAVENNLDGLPREFPLAQFCVLGRRQPSSVAQLNEVVTVQKTMLRSTPDHHPAFVLILTNLACDVSESYGSAESNLADYAEEVIRTLQKTLSQQLVLVAQAKETPLTSRTLTLNCCKLRGALCTVRLAQNSKDASLSHLEEASSVLCDLVSDERLTPRSRLRDTCALLEIIESEAITSSTTASQVFRLNMYKIYDHIVRLLPTTINYSLDHLWQLRELQVVEKLGSNAAFHAIQASSATAALRLLEQTRSVFWSQAILFRDRQIDLLPTHLAMELRSLLESLQTVYRANTSDVITHVLQFDINNITHTRQTSRLRDILIEARRLPGMDRLFIGHKPESLPKAASRSIVAMLVASAAECFAILMPNSTTEATYVRFPHVTQQVLRQWINSISGTYLPRGAAKQTHNDDSSKLDRLGMKTAQIKKEMSASQALHGLWQRIVEPIIRALGLKKREGRHRPRLHWCCTGEFTFLPLHAAGLHSDADPTGCWEYFVSSYIPSLSALIDAQKGFDGIPRDTMKALLIAQSISPGFVTLQQVNEEVSAVHGIFDRIPIEDPSLNVEPMHLELKEATTREVLDRIPNFNVLHLACHGIQDPDNPLRSGFALQNGLLKVADLMKMDMRNAFFAFLSACETASGYREQPDQNVHLAATMLSVGFRSVIATMWTMGDPDGPVIARLLYEELVSHTIVTVDDIAYALDAAVSHLRTRNASPIRWATFIHVGA